MTWLDALPFALLLGLAVAALWAHRAGAGPSVALRLLSKVQAFFGVAGAYRQTAVWLAAAAVAGMALDAFAHAHLGRDYPAWYRAVTIATGLAVGLVAARSTTRSVDRSEPDDAETADDPGESETKM